MKRSEPTTLDERLADDAWLDGAIKRAVRHAILDHKRTGDPIVVWEDGGVKTIPADEIEPLGAEREALDPEPASVR